MRCDAGAATLLYGMPDGACGVSTRLTALVSDVATAGLSEDPAHRRPHAGIVLDHKNAGC
jgi:hypothetical protein